MRHALPALGWMLTAGSRLRDPRGLGWKRSTRGPFGRQPADRFGKCEPLRSGRLVQALLEGADLRAVDPAAFMPPFARGFTDTEIAAMANYLIHRFGGKTGQVMAEQVRQNR